MQNSGIDLNRTARVIHEALSKTAEAIGQPAYPSWETAEDWMKESSLEGAHFVYANPNASVCPGPNSSRTTSRSASRWMTCARRARSKPRQRWTG